MSEASIKAGADSQGYVAVIVTDKGGASDGGTTLDLRLDPPAARDLAFELLSRAEEAETIRKESPGWKPEPRGDGS